MATLVYEKSNEGKEVNQISFTIDDELDIYEFKTICVRLASSLGYTESSIKKAFGYESGDFQSLDFDDLIKVLSGNNNKSKE